ncbi:Uncharacterised protein [Streptococcus pneumoniae]|uniref:hypothetical protein n=1 Tax=Streptococcus pneumoniae TaxID=1313 RepID=UPI0005E8A082|nr:hypothetical protein [Streptococcus pneumoniae]CAG5741798.1 Uncharacterised protein [Streptococcus pneumoniae]CEW33757.1 Uncharacterised protein [Streptococcus pneumoniae]CGG27016.1 Uncharacterised protein [Streptococcus pneumoniae]CIP75231.1 Uncharacterised protein [Streptococcus pneumoniae]CIQ85069.1 Uncharacterised protein [Streptococcus pneumoniae]
MTLDLGKMTQAEFDEVMADIKARNPNLLQFITDFLDGKVTPEEVDEFLKMERAEQVEYIKNYQARV